MSYLTRFVPFSALCQQESQGWSPDLQLTANSVPPTNSGFRTESKVVMAAVTQSATNLAPHTAGKVAAASPRLVIKGSGIYLEKGSWFYDASEKLARTVASFKAAFLRNVPALGLLQERIAEEQLIFDVPSLFWHRWPPWQCGRGSAFSCPLHVQRKAPRHQQPEPSAAAAIALDGGPSNACPRPTRPRPWAHACTRQRPTKHCPRVRICTRRRLHSGPQRTRPTPTQH